MAPLVAHGIELDLPAGWHGHIGRRERSSDLGADPGLRAASPTSAAEPVVAHAATFALPPERGDFGSGAVELMAGPDLFVSVVEFDPDSAGTALFRRTGLPRRFRADDFTPTALQRTLPGQAGVQAFFTEQDRPFCLYVVLGSYLRRGRTTPVVNGLLEGITIT